MRDLSVYIMRTLRTPTDVVRTLTTSAVYTRRVCHSSQRVEGGVYGFSENDSVVDKRCLKDL